MTPSWVQNNYNLQKPLKLNRDEKVMWSFTKKTSGEMQRRFTEGKGYLYWDQFLKIQPDLMVSAECKLKDIQDPFASKIKK